MAFQIRQKSDSVVSALPGSSQDVSSVSALANGGWVVTWQSNQSGNYDIYQSVYAADGTLAVDANNNFVANEKVVTSAANNQQVSTVAGLAGGGWVVTWQTDETSSGTTDLRQAVYRQDGSFAGETVVSAAGNSQAASSVSPLPNGGYVLVWQTKENGNNDIHQRVYDANGAPVSAESVVTKASSNQTVPSVAVLDNGGWVVTWETQGSGGTSDIHQRVYNANGTPLGQETVVSKAENNQYAPSVTALPGGGWVVTWQTDETSNGGSDIHQRVYKADGTLLGSEITVTEAANTQSAPVVTALFDDPENPNDGGWVVVWQTDGGTANNFDIHQRVYKADGTPLFAEEIVAEAVNNQSAPSVTALAGGGWVVSWQTDEAGAGSFDIRQRVYGTLTAGADEVIGDGADDTLTITAETFSPIDTLDGGEGSDTLILEGGGLFDFTDATIKNFETLDTTDGPLTTQFKGMSVGTVVKMSAETYAQFEEFDAKAGTLDVFEITDATLNDPQKAALFAQGFEVVYDIAGGPYYDPDANKPTVVIPPEAVLEDSAPVQVKIIRSDADDTDAAPTSHYKIAAVTGGTLYLDADATQAVTADSFVESAGKETILYFKPAENFFGDAGFSVTASKSDTDAGLGPTATATAALTVTPVNDAPTDITLTGAAVMEAAATGTLVGALAGVDVDGTAGHAFSLIDDAGGRFALSGNQLVVKNGVLLDYEQAGAHAVTVRLTDGAFVKDKVLLISVSNLTPEYVMGTAAADTVIGDTGRDTMYGGAGNDFLKGAGNNDTLRGDAGNDRLYGGSHNDLLYGAAGRDSLKGEAGNDRLWGGLHNDTLSGGSGKDVFVFDTKLGTATTDRKVNLDTVTDFSVPYDTIWLDNAIFKKLGSGSLSRPKKLNSKFFTVGDTAKDKDDYLIYNKKTGYLSYDADGSGAGKAVEFAKLKAGLKMTYADFFVV